MARKKNRFRILSVLITLSLLGGMILIGTLPASAAITPDTSWYDTNPEASEFTIYTAAELLGMSTLKNNFKGKTIYLGANIVFNEGNAADWAEGKNISGLNIWEVAASLEGTFDGQGHTISGLYNIDEATNTGLFSSLKSATVKNFALVNSYFKASNNSGFIAGAITTPDGPNILSDIYVDGIIEGGNNLGGIVGMCRANTGEPTDEYIFERCVFAGSVTGGNYVGGIIAVSGNLNVSFEDCANFGTVKAIGDKSVGGIVAIVQGDLTLKRCIGTGAIEYIENSNNFGAVIGTMSGATAKLTSENCYYTSSAASRAYRPFDEERLIGTEPTEVDDADIMGYAAMATLTGFDFDSKWVTIPGSYPLPTNASKMLGNVSMNTTLLGASIRYIAPAGMRFAMQIDKNSVYNELYGNADYAYDNDKGITFGVLMIPTSILGTDELTVATANVLNVEGKVVFDENDDAITITGVLKDIPENSDAYNKEITARGYIKVGDNYLYTDTLARSYVSVAKAAKDQLSSDVEDYEVIMMELDRIIGFELVE